MGTDRTQIKTDVETKVVPHIVFDTFVRRRLVVHLREYAASNYAPGERINFALWRRSINDWLATKNIRIAGTNAPFPEEIHENFFKQLLPNGRLEDIVELNTYSRNSLLLHVLVCFLEDVKYIDFQISDLFQNDREFRAAINYADCFTLGLARPRRNMAGKYVVTTDTVLCRTYPVDRDRMASPEFSYQEDFSLQTGDTVKTPTRDNKRSVGWLSVHETRDDIIFKATFSGDFVGERHSIYTGFLVQTEYEVRAELMDRSGRILCFSLSFLEHEDAGSFFEGAFMNCGTTGTVVIRKIGDIHNLSL